ncbi:MAG: hypothetical protein NC299_16020 [Lachnospiraceae bacterium]|nr:hypothetical protein [Ruminococcus sp.]MCM1276842.1 hypothetical protein [Lachnospiraceae bacterium]
MTKIKKIAAVAATVMSMGMIGATAFADAHWGNFDFSLQADHWDNYIDVSRGLEKHDDWNTAATVTVNSGNVSSSRPAFIRITANDSWPESYDISEEVRVTSHNGTIYTVKYNTTSSNLKYVQNNKVYLYATAGADDVDLGGFWTA